MYPPSLHKKSKTRLDTRRNDSNPLREVWTALDLRQAPSADLHGLHGGHGAGGAEHAQVAAGLPVVLERLLDLRHAMDARVTLGSVKKWCQHSTWCQKVVLPLDLGLCCAWGEKKSVIDNLLVYYLNN